MVTLKSIAKELGISVSTVSRAINNHPDISADTKREVLETIKRLNFTPNEAARSLIKRKLFTVGLMVPDVTDAHFSVIAGDVESSRFRTQWMELQSMAFPEPTRAITVVKIEGAH